MDRIVSAPLNASGGLMLILLALPLSAQNVSDPTQPPAALIGAVGPGESLATPAAGLQSILISRNPGGRKVAVINGQVLRIGDKFGSAVVINITPAAVVLRRGKAVETLKLFPRNEAGTK